jgi:GAF domain-containing protein
MVGRVTGTGKPRVALDVTADETHYKNPLLPDTRAEMVLPLQIGARIIGALDVQSTQPNAFSNEDITILQTLADQIAIAIENARLIQEAQENLKKLERLYAGYSQDAWQGLGETRSTLGYRYDASGVHPLRQNDRLSSSQVGDLPTVSIPLELRGQVIANLDVWPGPDGLDGEEVELLRSIADRLSQAMDSARLFEEAQKRARSERLVGEVTTRMRETLDIDSILRTAALEMRRSLNLAEVEVRLGNAPAPRRGNGAPSEEGPHAP